MAKADRREKTLNNQEEENQYAYSDPMAVTWSIRYSDTIQKYWDRLPGSIGTVIASLAVFILGCTLRGEWLLILVHFIRAFGSHDDVPKSTEPPAEPSPYFVLYGTEMKDFKIFLFAASAVSYIAYYGIGGFLHWYYYVRQRDRAHEWKCQPEKWLPPDLERHEILWGSFSLTLGALISSVLACYIVNGGWSTIYYDINEYGILWYLLSWPVVFCYQDYLTYIHHRLYHIPFLYKHFHKLHHKYKQPTAFSVTAIHPVEFVHLQAVVMSPMFFIPTHWTVMITILMYVYIHGILNHSGVNILSYWWQPWQPDTIFHDNHHQYFHVNFGFNIIYWDKLHGTYRQKDKVYREDIFYGEGKAIDECTVDELQEDLKEREGENTLAYRGKEKEEQVNFLKKNIK